MKKLTLASILILILATSLVKNSTKEIEDKTFSINENIRSLKVELDEVKLEYNFLSSPEKLSQYQFQYYENDLKKIDIMEIKKIIISDDYLEITDFIDKSQLDE
jgi:cell division protein FtsL|tara:strand:+ start:627 stop:938 length:312 start_codon:yes stop_codon:yes gene_type:complete